MNGVDSDDLYLEHGEQDETDRGFKRFQWVFGALTGGRTSVALLHLLSYQTVSFQAPFPTGVLQSPNQLDDFVLLTESFDLTSGTEIRFSLPQGSIREILVLY